MLEMRLLGLCSYQKRHKKNNTKSKPVDQMIHSQQCNHSNMQMTQIYNEHLTVFLFKVFLIEYFKKKCF